MPTAAPPPGVVGRSSSLLTPTLAALTLALLLGLQPITTDVYLPALPLLTHALGASMRAVQLTMSGLILAFGLAQMVWGPIADRVGRRPVLLWGLALYGVASLGCTLAPDIEALVAWRIVQGAGMASAVVCARAMVRDLYAPAEGARVMSLALSGLGLIALTGPLAGGLFATAFGWRGPLALVTVASVLCLAYVAWRVPETLAVRNPQATRLRPLLQSWGRVGRHPVFVAWASLTACTYGGLFTILAGSSFVFMNVLGLGSAAYGGTLALGSISYIAGTFMCRRWIPRHGTVGTVGRGAWLSLAGGVSMAVLAACDVQAVWAVLLPHCLFAFGHGQHQPCGQSGLVGPFPQAAGAASALAGLLLAVVAFAIGRWLGVSLDGTTRPLAYTLCFWSVLTAAMAWGPVRRWAK
jgi:DHA1 family bicyclomycin/chloramphenicol resistance-like MFS transporter